MTGRWGDLIDQRLDRIRTDGRWRSVRTLDSGSPRTAVSGSGAPVVSFASNDYLGLSQHPLVAAAATDAIARFGTGSGSARLIVGSRPVHDELETALSDWKGTDAALLFSTGYQANLGALGALVAAAPDVLVHSDALNHASIIDGARLSRAEVAVFPHRDLATLRDRLAAAPDRPHLVVTDDVFSMDGDRADLVALHALCAQFDALLVVDVAHTVLDPVPLPGAVLVGTLSKTLGALGGFVAGPQPVIDLCRNTARSFIFTTALSPADAAAANAAIGVIRSGEGTALIARLRANVAILNPAAVSPIVPVLLGSEERAVAAAAALLERGMVVPAIRPPTVAPGACRLRVALSAAHDTVEVTHLRDTLNELGFWDSEGDV